MTNGKTDKPEAPSAGREIERLLDVLVEAMPILDRKTFDAAVAEIRARPHSSMHALFNRFDSPEPAMRAVVARLLVECGGADVIDNLNAVIFDAEAADEAKVRANDILERLGQPVDPDVFGMSVADPEPIRRQLPSRVREMLNAGDPGGAVRAARDLEQAERTLLINDVLRDNAPSGIEFVEQLAESHAADARAAVAAIGAETCEAGLPLLTRLQERADRDLLKLIKKTLYDLREEGVAVPETKPAEPAGAETPTKQETELPIYKAMMSEVSPQGTVVVVVSRMRPDRRLKVFTALVSLWRRGIQQAGFNPNMSRSSFDRFVKDHAQGQMKMRPASLDDCRRMVARGMRVAHEFGTPIPFDFGVGKTLLGDVDAEAANLNSPFICSGCGQPLDEETVAKIRASAAYENIPVETRCPACRGE